MCAEAEFLGDIQGVWKLQGWRASVVRELKEGWPGPCEDWGLWVWEVLTTFLGVTLYRDGRHSFRSLSR